MPNHVIKFNYCIFTFINPDEANMKDDGVPECSIELEDSDKRHLEYLLRSVAVGDEDEEKQCADWLESKTDFMKSVLVTSEQIISSTSHPCERVRMIFILSETFYRHQLKWEDFGQKVLDSDIPWIWSAVIRDQPLQNIKYLRQLISTWESNKTFNSRSISGFLRALEQEEQQAKARCEERRQYDACEGDSGDEHSKHQIKRTKIWGGSVPPPIKNIVTSPARDLRVPPLPVVNIITPTLPPEVQPSLPPVVPTIDMTSTTAWTTPRVEVSRSPEPPSLKPPVVPFLTLLCDALSSVQSTFQWRPRPVIHYRDDNNISGGGSGNGFYNKPRHPS